MAHAVVLQVKLPPSDSPEEGLTMLKDFVVPQAQAVTGFQHGIWMHDGLNGMGVVVFDTAENAAAAVDQLKPPPGGPELVSGVVYEVGAEA
jgi:hypothetical protein